jgi:hypothetical protein
MSEIAMIRVVDELTPPFRHGIVARVPRGLHVRRERLGGVHRSRATIEVSVAPHRAPTRPIRTFISKKRSTSCACARVISMVWVFAPPEQLVTKKTGIPTPYNRDFNRVLTIQWILIGILIVILTASLTFNRDFD